MAVAVVAYMDEFGDCSELFHSYDMIDEMDSGDFSARMADFDKQIGFAFDNSSLMTIDDVLMLGKAINETMSIGDESPTAAPIVIDVTGTMGSSEYDPICFDVDDE